MRFVIEYISSDRKRAVIFARRVEPGDFTLSAQARLGEVAVHPIVSQPRQLRPDGTPDLDVFAFTPRDRSRLKALSIGDEVTLHP